MKAVILAGGYGTRISEESHLKPKPMIEIGGKPILWHIMKIYSHFGIDDFIICAGYKQHIIKEWFANYFLYSSNITFNFNGKKNKIVFHDQYCEPWEVTVVDTGLDTMTGGRIKRIQKYVKNESFALTYGDGVGNINIKELINFHKNHGKIATITSVTVEQNKGVLDIHEDFVQAFREKSNTDSTRINGGFMILEPQIFDYIENDETIFERGPMNQLAQEKQLLAYRHDGFWQCMDTKREMERLEQLWQSGAAPWKVWEE